MNVVLGAPTLGQNIDFAILGDEIKKAANEYASLVGDLNYKSGELLRKTSLAAEMQEYLRGTIDSAVTNELIETYIDLTAFFRLQGIRFSEIENNNISAIMYNFEVFLQDHGVQLGGSYANHVLNLLEPRNTLGRFLVQTGLVSESEISQMGVPIPGSDLDKESELRSLRTADKIRSRLSSSGLGGFIVPAWFVYSIITILVGYLVAISTLNGLDKILGNKTAIQEEHKLYRARAAVVEEEFKSGKITQQERDSKLKQAAEDRDKVITDLSGGPSVGTIVVFSAIGIVGVGILWNAIFK